MRVLPRLNEDVNEEWISDKTRFSYDGLKRRRLDVPMVKRDGKLRPAELARGVRARSRERLTASTAARPPSSSAIWSTARPWCWSGSWPRGLGTPHVDCRQDGAKLEPGGRAGYLFNTTIAGIERADACLLIGTNPRREAAIINARLRKRWRRAGSRSARIGAPGRPDLPGRGAGCGPGDAGRPWRAASIGFAETLRERQAADADPGGGCRGAARRCGGLALARELADGLGWSATDWNGFNVLHTAASRVGGLDLGLVPGRAAATSRASSSLRRSGEIDVLFLIGADEIDTEPPRQGLRRLPGQPRRPGRRGRRRDPAGCRLHREERQLGQHRGPAAARPARRLPAGRGQGGLEDPARPLRGAGLRRAARHAGPGARADGGAGAGAGATLDVVSPAAWGAFGRAGELDRARLRLADHRLLPDQPDQPRLGGDGGVQRAVRGTRGRAGSDRHPWLRSGPLTVTVGAQILLIVVPLLVAVAYAHLCRAQGDRRHAAPAGADDGRALRAAAAAGRRAQAVRQGDGGPDRAPTRSSSSWPVRHLRAWP